MISYISLKNLKVISVLTSEPIILIKGRIIIDKNISRINRVTINEVIIKLREKSVFNLSDVEFAIMESDGKVSLLVKADNKSLTPIYIFIQTVNLR